MNPETIVAIILFVVLYMGVALLFAGVITLIFNRAERQIRLRDIKALGLKDEDEYREYTEAAPSKAYRSGYYRAMYNATGTDITSEDRLD